MRGMTHAVEQLPSKYKALSSSPTTVNDMRQTNRKGTETQRSQRTSAALYLGTIYQISCSTIVLE
jgi:hypothetical protein